MSALSGVVLFSLLCPAAGDQRVVLSEWQFQQAEDLQAWSASNHVADLKLEDGALCGRLVDWDPFVRSPQFQIAATPYQRIELRIKTDCGGPAELYWTNTTDSPYGGFSPSKRTAFSIRGDGQWHEYHVYPFWHNERNIILLRVDFPRPAQPDFGRKTFAIDSIRIVDLGTPDVTTASPHWDFSRGLHGWHAADGGRLRATDRGAEFAGGPDASGHLTSGPLRCDLQDNFWVHVEMQVDRGSAAYLRWVSSRRDGMHQRKFPIQADGRFHHYNVDLSGDENWLGEALFLGLQPSNTADASAVVRSIALGMDPLGDPEVQATYLGLEDAVNRAGQPATLVLNLINRGGTATAAGQLQIDRLQLPDGVSVADDGTWRELPALEPFEPTTHCIRVVASGPVTGQVRAQLAGPGAPADPVTGVVEIAPAIALPHAAYVPKPRPVETDYEIGAYYFPGWASMAKWQPIRSFAPRRKPVLGWYDEGNPECVDWQIKWAVEHGIRFFLVDWYWHAGSRQLEHWLDAYRQARYRSYLQWAVMWANHNPAGSHSEQDMRAVARFWVDHYFGMPEYLRLDNRPVVVMWSPQNVRRDLGGPDGGRRALEIARQVAREAGYEGIYFIAMKWPEASTDPAVIQPLADDGYDMTSIYHYMHDGGQAEDARDFSFDLVARSSLDFWQARHEAGVLPFLPNVSTGWDSRPWHGERATVIHSRSAPLFRKICEDAKRFADQSGIRRLALAPLNEWGEGSYVEPNKEFGFGMYDAVRDVFCKRPADGWPPNITPRDVGLGPYDFPLAEPGELVTAWTFVEDAGGWSPLMGISDLRHEQGAVHFRTTSDDSALIAVVNKLPAADYPLLRIRMRIDAASPGERAQLFWSTTTSPIGEANSVRFDLVGDGQLHEYVVPLQENRRWRGRINMLRFDPCSHRGAEISIAEIRLAPDTL
jgi:hypothetical protein